MKPDAMNSAFYILVDRKPVVEPDFIVWANWLNDEGARADGARVVGKDQVGNFEVSTVFIGLHGTMFETVVFDRASKVRLQWRYPTWDEAVEGHRRALAHVAKMEE